eukprot:g16477.t1
MQSPLWLCCRWGQGCEMLKLLHQAEADLEQADVHQVTPLECCALFAEDVAMLKELVMLGVKTERLLTNWEQIQHLAPEGTDLSAQTGRLGFSMVSGFSDQVLTQFTKMAATSLSSNTLGQIFVGLMVNPPKPGDPSHELFEKETSAIFQGLTRRALRMTEALNKCGELSYFR